MQSIPDATSPCQTWSPYPLEIFYSWKINAITWKYLLDISTMHLTVLVYWSVAISLPPLVDSFSQYFRVQTIMHHDMETKSRGWNELGVSEEKILLKVFSNKDTDCKLLIKLYMLRLASTKYAL